MEYNVLPLFSSPIFTTHIDISNHHPDWNTVEWAKDPTRDYSEQDDILDHAEWKLVRDQIQSALKYFFYDTMLASKEIDIDISISWLNRNNHGQKHVPHWHPNIVFSGCLYFDHSDAGITFTGDRYPQIHWAKENWNVLNSQTWTIKPEPGLLLIWPSHLQHEVQAMNPGDITRYSLAFNTWLTGNIWKGRQMSLTL